MQLYFSHQQSPKLCTTKVLQLPWSIALVKRDYVLSWKFTTALTCEFRLSQNVPLQRGDLFCSMKTSRNATCVCICLPWFCEHVRERITAWAAPTYPPSFEGVRFRLSCKWATEAQPAGPHTHTHSHTFAQNGLVLFIKMYITFFFFFF